jgi:hypothetical protein
MLVVVVLLGALVWALAKAAPADPNAGMTTSLGPDQTIAATGATGVPSPATAGGYGNTNMISSANQLRTSMAYQNTYDDSQKVLPGMTPNQGWQNRQRGSSQTPNYLTDAQSSLMTQDQPAQTTTVYDNPDSSKL